MTVTIESDFAAAYERVLGQWPDGEVTEVSSRWGTTRVLSSGPVGGPPLLLLPGGGATATAWFATAGALAEHFRVHAVDLPGNAGYTVVSVADADELCRWLDTVVEAVGGGGPVALAGHSYGGWVALTYALHAPVRVRRLALLDPTMCFAGLAPRYLLHAIPVLVRPGRRTAGALVRWETGGRALDPAWTALHGLGAELPSTGKLVARPRPAADRIRTLRVPTLVLVAGQSRAHDPAKVAVGARELLPQVTTTVLAGASHHSLPLDPAPAVSSALVDFLGAGG